MCDYVWFNINYIDLILIIPEYFYKMCCFLFQMQLKNDFEENIILSFKKWVEYSYLFCFIFVLTCKWKI